ncbi:MAG: hypothetical protein EU541_04470 [Promethearchaeota archaeon]|nr:MAG: hypothetical protein EU541_04470 [Candidatus Lokiarchaeota archaeon]
MVVIIVFLFKKIELPSPKGRWIRNSSRIAGSMSVLHPLQTLTPVVPTVNDELGYHSSFLIVFLFFIIILGVPN